MNIDRDRPSKLVVLAGVSGTGKSKIAWEVSHNVGSPVILEIDVVKQVLDESGLPSVNRFNVNSPTGPVTMRRSYESLQERASLLLKGGHDVIAVGTHRSVIAQQRIARVAEEAGAEFHPYVLTAPREILEARVSRRPKGHMSGIVDPAEVRRMLEGFADFPGARQLDTSVLSKSETVRTIVTEVWGAEYYRPDRLIDLIKARAHAFRRLRSG